MGSYSPPVMAYLQLCYTALLTVIYTCTAQASDSHGNCTFSRDCDSYNLCQTIQDAGCVCNFGQCVIRGNPFFRGTQCEEYTDCACRGTPETCFCQNGFCQESRWECHEARDCSRLSKCRDKECACSGDLCEHECDKDSDCKDFHCNTALGYTCKCEKSLCAYKQKDKECNSIRDCVNKGLCQAGTPCACTQEYCTLPWWVQGREPHQHCRSTQDCEEMILNCEGGKCSCEDLVLINTWDSRGTCRAKAGVDNTKQDESDKKEKITKIESKKSEIQFEPKQNSARIIFPTEVDKKTEDDEVFAIKKLGY